MEAIIGAFIFPDVWQAWNAVEADRVLRSLRDFGVNAIATESERYRDDLIELAHRLDMRFIGGIACFSEHGSQHKLLSDRPELWPILETGERRPVMEWYVGVTPTFEYYSASKLDLIERVMREHELDAMCLDFIRWPLHWELELRPTAPRPLHSSFDSHTVDLFLRKAGLERPAFCDTIPKLAAWIMNEHFMGWVDFKCSVITAFVAQARERVNVHRHGRALLGAYLVPAPQGERAALVGQRIQDLAPLLDFLAPMAYHAILHQSADWVAQVIDEVGAHIPGKVLPVLQVDSTEGTEMGADWGPPVPTQQWQQIACNALQCQDAMGLIAFTGTSLFRDDRGRILRACLSPR